MTKTKTVVEDFPMLSISSHPQAANEAAVPAMIDDAVTAWIDALDQAGPEAPLAHLFALRDTAPSRLIPDYQFLLKVITQKIARPVLLDAAEGEDDRSRGRIQAILELARGASLTEKI